MFKIRSVLAVAAAALALCTYPLSAAPSHAAPCPTGALGYSHTTNGQQTLANGSDVLLPGLELTVTVPEPGCKISITVSTRLHGVNGGQAGPVTADVRIRRDDTSGAVVVGGSSAYMPGPGGAYAESLLVNAIDTPPPGTYVYRAVLVKTLGDPFVGVATGQTAYQRQHILAYGV